MSKTIAPAMGTWAAQKEQNPHSSTPIFPLDFSLLMPRMMGVFHGFFTPISNVIPMGRFCAENDSTL